MDGHRGGLLSLGRGGDTADLREHNLGLVLRYLRDNGPSSRAQIAAASKLGLSTLTGMIGELKALDLVSEGLAESQARLGRPTHAVSLSGERWVVAGLRLDVDGIQAKTATVGGQHLGHYVDRLLLHGSDATLASSAIESAVKWIIESVDKARTLAAIEIAVPGSVSPGGGAMTRSESLGWAQSELLAPVKAIVESFGLSGVTVGLASDSSLSVLGLVRGELSEAAATSTVAYFGGDRALVGDVVIRGEPFRGAGPGAADFSRIPVALGDGRRETLGTAVGLDILLSAAGVLSPEAAALSVGAAPRDAVASLADALRDGQPVALAAVDDASDALASAAECVVAVLGVDVIVLDGYLGALGEWLVPRLDARLSDHSVGARLVALAPSPSRAVDGAVAAARDACLSRPTRIRA
jgi:predicted NBD/HSP70 family sugar kinase